MIISVKSQQFYIIHRHADILETVIFILSIRNQKVKYRNIKQCRHQRNFVDTFIFLVLTH